MTKRKKERKNRINSADAGEKQHRQTWAMFGPKRLHGHTSLGGVSWVYRVDSRNGHLSSCVPCLLLLGSNFFHVAHVAAKLDADNLYRV